MANLTQENLIWLRDYFKRKAMDGHNWLLCQDLESVKGSVATWAQMIQALTESTNQKERGE